MPLSAGTRLGPYEILSALGAGGMGEVYRARDTRLDRDVAIKLLPEAFAADVERVARFQREAKVLASLNHPHISAIYGLEDADGVKALVMELVEGEDLSQRLARGAIPLDEAWPIAKQIAEALEAAHEQGIIHRDLKPANVKIASDDTVKVLDFGLAKALEGDSSAAPLPNSPTVTWMATQAGVLLGTAAYMSPEQAKGKPADRRADIWAFGCVVYEMLTGRTAFRGETVTDTLAAVIREEPDWTRLPATTPPHLRLLLRRCLQKDVRQRLQAIGDARITLDEGLAGGMPSGATPVGAQPGKWRLVAGLAGALVLGAVAGLVVWNLKPSPAPPRPVTRFTISLPPGQRLAGLDEPALALSADGSQLAFVATAQGGVQQIYLRTMDGMEARPIEGTEGATNPLFSPDGQWLGFFIDGKLKKISVKGGIAQTLSDVTNPFGASWGSDHTIAFAPSSSVLQQVSDDGGTPQPLTRFETGETRHVWPEFLPGSKAVLFTVFSATGSSAIAVQPIGTGARRDLLRSQAGIMPRYAPSGHLIYTQAGNLMAVPFDLERLEVKSGVPALPVVQGVLQYSLSATGSLVYVSGSPPMLESRMVWVSRDGTVQTLGAAPGFYNQPRLSPDGRRVAVDINKMGDMQVWLYDLARDTLTPLTFGGVNRHTVWTPDSNRIVFMSYKNGATQIFWQLANGSGGLEALTNDPPAKTADVLNIPYSLSPDGVLTFSKVFPTKEAEFWSLQVSPPSTGSGQGRKAQRFLKTRTTDGAPQLSPDGHWLAYASDESGHEREIYVRAYPGPGGPWRVSTDGGNEPQWNPRGGELFYRSGNKMMAVGISTQAGFAAGKPRRLFEGDYLTTYGGYARADYDVSTDGERFLMLKRVQPEQAPVTQISVVLNWSEELKRLVPPGK